MALNRNESGAGKTRSLPVKGKLPVKRTINLATAGMKPMNIKAAVLGIVLIIFAAGAFGKFAVADRLIAMNREQQKASSLQSQLNGLYAEIASYSGIEDEYAHYTWSGMTEEELSRVARPEIIRMIEKELADKGEAVSWTLSGNILTLTVAGSSLQEVNEMARTLEGYDIVSLCTVTTAVKDDKETASTDGKVRANIVAYLENAEEGGAK